MILAKRRRLAVVVGVGLLLLIPMIAMQFTDEVRWSPSDFVVAGALLLGAGYLGELVPRQVQGTAFRISLYVAIFAAVAVVWLELAVGLFETPFAGS